MDNPQFYQPLSHALHPPLVRSPQLQYIPYSHASAQSNAVEQQQQQPTHGQRHDKGDDNDEDDEEVVEEELAGGHDGAHEASSQPASPALQQQAKAVTGSGTDAAANRPNSNETQDSNAAKADAAPTPVKRRPGRPKGSKTRRTAAEGHPPGYATYYAYQPQPQTYQQPLHPTGSGTAPPLHPNVNDQNQQYYEFQWRVLNLCAEFYGAAEELVKGTAPLVLAQCYQMGPASKVDPLIMLAEAKRNCDLLLANPSQLLTHPPPPLYPALPAFTSWQHYAQPQAQPSPSGATPNANTTTPAGQHQSQPPVITNPSSFILSLSGSPSASGSASNAPNYPASGATSYYQQYAPTNTSTYYSGGVSQSSNVADPGLSAGAGGGPAVGGNQGAWSNEETERLKTLAEQSKAQGTTGEIEWDWVINQWGPTRTRHQILIKATSLGLKESTGRGTKRRREDTATGASPGPSAPLSAGPAMKKPTSAAPLAQSPVHSQSASGSAPTSTQASPAMQHSQPHAPATSSVPPPATASSSPWPMPAMASATGPIISTTSTSAQETSRTNYYRSTPSKSPHVQYRQ